MRIGNHHPTAILLVLLWRAGCGGDAAGPEIPTYPNVAGTWTYNASNLSGAGGSCNVTGLILTISQSGGTFSGSYSGGNTSCVIGAQNYPAGPSSGTIVSGTVTEGGTISFDFDTADWRNSGTIVGSSASGTATVRLDLGAPVGVLVLSGNWAIGR